MGDSIRSCVQEDERHQPERYFPLQRLRADARGAARVRTLGVRTLAFREGKETRVVGPIDIEGQGCMPPATAFRNSRTEFGRGYARL
jgi:hypothetical protein